MKVRELQRAMAKKGIDISLFFIDDPNIFYFSQVPYLNFSVLCVPQSSEPFLAVPKMDFDKSKEYSRIKRVICLEKKKASEFILDYLKKERIPHRKIGINESFINLLTFQRMRYAIKGRYVDIGDECMGLRSVKTEDEIKYIRKASAIADDALSMVNSDFRYETEAELAAALEFYAKELGCEEAFKTIVASGYHSSFPHHTAVSEKLRKGFCIIDYGVKYKGYCCDVSRTFYIGKPSKKEVEIYNKVLDTQESSIFAAEEGKTGSDLYNFAAKKLGKFSKYFTHGLGHGLGVQIHEKPSLSPESKDVLKKDMAFTVEPGVYFPNKFGIRIEDTVLLKDKAIPLHKFRKDLIVVKNRK